MSGWIVLPFCYMLISSDAVLDLTDENGAIIAARIKIKLCLVSEPEQGFMQRVDADMSRLDGNTILANVSGHIDATTSVAQTGIEVASTLGTCIAPLGQALQLIVRFMDGIADVCFYIGFKSVGTLTWRWR